MTEQPQTFTCPSCGAPLNLQRAEHNLVTCPYCSKSVIVPENLRDPEDSAPQRVVFQLPPDSTPVMEPVQPRRGVGCLILTVLTVVILAVLGAAIAPVLLARTVVEQASSVIPTSIAMQPDIATMVAMATSLPGTLAASDPATLATPGFGTVEMTFGSKGSGPGQLSDARWLAVDGQGSIYTLEYADGRVQKFGPDGTFELSWNLGSKGKYASGIAVNRKGVLYVTNGGEILKFASADGKPLGKVAFAGDHFFESLAASADGSLLTVNRGETIVRFDANEKVSLTVPKAISTQTGKPELDARVAVDGLGNIYLLGSFSKAVFVYSPQGKFLNRFGSAGNQPGQFRAVQDIAVDGQGRVYVSDIFGVEVFHSDGRFVNSVDVHGTPFGLAVDDLDALYIASNAPNIEKVVMEP